MYAGNTETQTVLCVVTATRADFVRSKQAALKAHSASTNIGGVDSRYM